MDEAEILEIEEMRQESEAEKDKERKHAKRSQLGEAFLRELDNYYDKRNESARTVKFDDFLMAVFNRMERD